MAITRRQFVTRLGALAAAAGLGQADVSRITEAFAYGTTDWKTTTDKPRVVWVHGAECTGCSTSVLGLFEDATGNIPYTAVSPLSTLAATRLATGLPALAGSDLTLHGGNGTWNAGVGNDVDFNAAIGEPSTNVINIQDVLIDIIELDYHETVMSMGGDLAAKWLQDFMTNVDAAGKPFVLVVEGAIADADQGGAWADNANNGEPWCAIGMTDGYNTTLTEAANNALSQYEHAIDHVVATLAAKTSCAAVIAIGQCATFGGYPGCVAPIEASEGGFSAMSQSGAKGTYDFLEGKGLAAKNKVINVPGCPTNPWWFILTVVAWIVDFENASRPLGVLLAGGGINPAAVDSTRRLKAVYPTAIHGPYCPRFNDWSLGIFAEKPGDPGCLQKIGCKGPAVKSLCGVHGWNAQQPENDGFTAVLGDPSSTEFDLYKANEAAGGNRGGHCTRAGHPCMGCTEKGYPDSFVPFVSW